MQWWVQKVSTKKLYRMCVSQTFLSLTNFIEKSNNIYDIKCASYKNIFYDEYNDTNLIPSILAFVFRNLSKFKNFDLEQL